MGVVDTELPEAGDADAPVVADIQGGWEDHVVHAPSTQRLSLA